MTHEAAMKIVEHVDALWPRGVLSDAERLAFSRSLLPLAITLEAANLALDDERMQTRWRSPDVARLLARLRSLDRSREAPRPEATRPSPDTITDAEYARIMADRAEARGFVEALHDDDLRELADGLAEYSGGMVRLSGIPRGTLLKRPNACGFLAAYARMRARREVAA